MHYLHRPTYSCARALTYLHSWLYAYKTVISETVEDKAKVTVNDLYKIGHGLSIAAKIYDLECPVSEIQGHRFLKCHKNDEIQLSTPTPCRVTGGIISRPTYSCVHVLYYLLTYLLICTEK